MMRQFEVWMMGGKRVLVRLSQPLQFDYAWGFWRKVKELQ